MSESNVLAEKMPAGNSADRGSATAGGRSFTAALNSDTLITIASVLTLVLIWVLASWLLPANVLPSPVTVLGAMGELARTRELWSDIAITLWRIALSFALGMSTALVLGAAMALSPRTGTFFRVWIVCGITVPAIVTILTVYLSVGMNDRGAVLGAALTVVPFLTINIREGIKALDTRLLQMGQVFRASRGQVVRSIVIPQIAPMLLASSRFGLGLVWKMVLFVELLGRGNGVGFRIEYYFQLFSMVNVLAYALCFVLVMLVIEVGIFGVLERRIFRWRHG
jgi:NitT/TauT family transport system permease protein